MQLILHHYDISPYAEKIRLVMGLKKLAWQSVGQPMVLPKPDLVALTGGYRRIPVLQIGADIFCDTNLIGAVLDRMHPQPPLYPDGKLGETGMWCSWAERVLMWPTARYVTAVNDDRLGASFHKDRADMRGHAPPSAQQVADSIPYNREQCLIMLRWLEGIFSDGREFLLGGQPGLADFGVYQRVWWLEAFGGKAMDVLQEVPKVVAWTQRIKAIGHGQRSNIDPGQAHRIARESRSNPSLRAGTPMQSPAIGQAISVGTEGHAPDAVTGVVVSSTSEEIAIERKGEDGITTVVHFPRLGYEWRAQQGAMQ